MTDIENPMFYVNEEHVEIVNGIYSYNFSLDLTKEITDFKTAASLITFEQRNEKVMQKLFTENINVISLKDLIEIANKLRLILLAEDNIDSLS